MTSRGCSLQLTRLRTRASTRAPDLGQDDLVKICCCNPWKTSDPFTHYEEISNATFPPLIGSDGKKISYSDDLLKASSTLLAQQRLERKMSGCNSTKLCWTGMGYVAAISATTTLILFLTGWIYAEVRELDKCFATQTLMNFSSTVATEICAKQLDGKQHIVIYDASAIAGGIVLFSAVMTVFGTTISSLYKSPYFIESLFPRPCGSIVETILVGLLLLGSFAVNAVLIVVVLIELHTSSFLVASFAAAVSIPVATSVFAGVVYQYLPSLAAVSTKKE